MSEEMRARLAQRCKVQRLSIRSVGMYTGAGLQVLRTRFVNDSPGIFYPMAVFIAYLGQSYQQYVVTPGISVSVHDQNDEIILPRSALIAGTDVATNASLNSYHDNFDAGMGLLPQEFYICHANGGGFFGTFQTIYFNFVGQEYLF